MRSLNLLLLYKNTHCSRINPIASFFTPCQPLDFIIPLSAVSKVTCQTTAKEFPANVHVFFQISTLSRSVFYLYNRALLESSLSLICESAHFSILPSLDEVVSVFIGFLSGPHYKPVSLLADPVGILPASTAMCRENGQSVSTAIQEYTFGSRMCSVIGSRPQFVAVWWAFK